MASIRSSQVVTTLSLTNTQRSYRGTVSESQPDRYYKIRLGQRSRVTLSLTGLKSDADLALLNQTGKALRRASRNGRTDESIASTLNAGTYYVSVHREAGNTGYKLKLAATASPSRSSSQLKTMSPVEQVLELTNERRARAGLRPLKLNAKLSAAAQAHSESMAHNDFFSHIGSDGSTAAARVARAGYNAAATGENIAAGYASARTIVSMWMNSPGHRANILSRRAKEIGIGFYYLDNDPGDVDFKYYWTQNFAIPAEDRA